MIALRRADVRELNEQARQRMRDAGHLGPDVELRGGTFAQGDYVVLKRNDRRLGVTNGELAVVQAVTSTGTMTVTTAKQRTVLPLRYLQTPAHRPAVQHAYAITGQAEIVAVERNLPERVSPPSALAPGRLCGR